MKRARSSYYSIKPKVAFGTPTYIHSHTTTIKDITNGIMPAFQQLTAIVNEIRDNYDRAMEALLTARFKLDVVQKQLINAGYPVDNDGRPLQVSQLLIAINKEINDTRAVITGAKKSRRIQAPEKTSVAAQELLKRMYDKQGKYAKETVNEFFNSERFLESYGSAVGKHLLSRLTTMLNSSWGHKKGTEKNQYSKEKVLDLSYKVIVENLKNYTETGQERLRKELTRSVKEQVGIIKQEYDRLIERLKTYLPVLNNLENIDAAKVDSETRQILKILSDKDRRLEIMKLGILEELVIVQANSIEQAQEGVSVKVHDTLVNIGSKEGITGGDSFTTDIKGMLDGLEGAIAYGISVKLNPRYFRKTEKNIPATQSYPKLSAIKDAFTDKQNGLIYYILNYQALSLVSFPFAAPKTYKSYYVTDTLPPVKSDALSADKYDLIGMLEKALISDAFIKALIGEAFSAFYSGQPTLDEIAAAQGLPVMLQTLRGKVWMTEIIDNMIEILKEYKSKPEQIIKMVENYTPYDKYGGKEQEISQLLVELFKAKLRNYAEEPRGEENRYDELIQDSEVLSILNQLEKINKIRYGKDKLNNLFSKKWMIKFDFTAWTLGKGARNNDK